MKTISTIIINVCIIATLSMNISKATAQCSSPRLQFSNPTLVSGTALSAGATYKFPNVMAGVDCYIRVVSIFGGATLQAMETPGQGYPDAWQPIIGGPGSPALNRSGINFRVTFKTTAGANYGFPCLDISAIDVDGDGGRIGEFVESDGHTLYSIPSPTLMVITDLGSGRIRCQGPTTNRPSIDTSALDVRASFYFNGRDSIDLTLGSFVFNNSGGAAATDRLNCIYFSKITGAFAILPTSYMSFDGANNMGKVLLNWQTENEINTDHFEVERSFDNTNFKTVGYVLDALTVNGNKRDYKFMDNAAELKSRSVAYYRLKQVDANQQYTYSKVIAVKLQNTTGTIEAGPNPFVDRINVSFNSTEARIAELRISNITGKTVFTKSYNVNNGFNNIQVNGLGKLSAGMYMVQVMVNGVAMETQKMIKN